MNRKAIPRAFGVSLACLVYAAAAHGTPVPWPVSAGGNGHSYDFVPGTRPWTQARTDAPRVTFNGVPGYLATITSPAESDFVRDHFAPVQAWIGGYQDRTAPDYVEPAGGWQWVTGEPWGHTDWASQFGFPDDVGNVQDYLKYAGGPWWDDLENDARPGVTGVDGFLVEFNTVPEPAASAALVLPAALLALRRFTRR